MPLDPRIAMGLQVPDIAGSIRTGMDWHDQREQKSRLADLLPQAAHGDQGAIDQLWAVDPRIAEHMDDRQRQKAQSVIGDLSNAVRWADTPEKWQYVQQHYGQSGVDLSQYGFQDRERGLVALNQIGGYLKDAPKPEYRAIEAGGSLIDVSNGQPHVVIAPNPGGHDTGSPVQGGGPQPGQVIGGFRYKGGDPNDRNSWEQAGGQTGYAPSGGFPR